MQPKGRIYRFLYHSKECVGLVCDSSSQFIIPFSSNDTLEIIDNFEAFYTQAMRDSNIESNADSSPSDNDSINKTRLESNIDSSVDSTRATHSIAPNPQPIALDSITPLAPIKSPRQDVICLGINYMAHAAESARFKQESFSGKRDEAVYFSKRVNECTPPHATFSSSQSTQLDYEVELAVIIARDCRNVSQENAKEYIFGYSVCNDISARDLQAKHKQWYAGKSLEGSFVLGPCIVLRDSLNPSNLSIKSFVNGELRQNSNTAQMIFGIDYVISQLSHYFTLKSGSIIAMGTPSGVGMGFNPPKFLKAGDVIKCEIEGIGAIVTTMI